MTNQHPLIDLKPLLDTLHNSARSGLVTDANGRQYLWDEKDKCYNSLEINPIQLAPIVRTVSTADSLGAVVLEEAQRAGHNKGERMTLLLDDEGATFWTNDSEATRHQQWRYRRQKSQQWEALTRLLGRQLTGKQLYTALQGLAPSIVGANDVVQSFKSVQVVDNGTYIDSNTFTDGTNTNLTSSSITVSGGSEGDKNVKIPKNISFRLPIVRGATTKYEVTANVEIGTERRNDKTHVCFSLYIPTFDLTKEQLLIDESDYFAEQLAAKLPRLLIGMNYGS